MQVLNLGAILDSIAEGCSNSLLQGSPGWSGRHPEGPLDLRENMADQSPHVSMLPESLQVLRLIWAFQIGLEHTSEAMASNIGVTGRQRFILRLAGLLPDLTVEKLSATLGVDRSKLEADVTHLVTSGLLANKVSAPDAPAPLDLTRAGAMANATWRGTVESAVSRALDEATPTERAAFRRMLERMTPYLHPSR